MDVAERQVETRIPTFRAFGGGTIETGRVDDIGAEACWTNVRAVRTCQTSRGHGVPTWMLEVFLEAFGQTLRVQMATHGAFRLGRNRRCAVHIFHRCSPCFDIFEKGLTCKRSDFHEKPMFTFIDEFRERQIEAAASTRARFH